MGEKRHCCGAILVFTLVDKKGGPLPDIVPVTAQQKTRWKDAEVRRTERMKLHSSAEAAKLQKTEETKPQEDAVGKTTESGPSESTKVAVEEIPQKEQQKGEWSDSSSPRSADASPRVSERMGKTVITIGGSPAVGGDTKSCPVDNTTRTFGKRKRTPSTDKSREDGMMEEGLNLAMGLRKKIADTRVDMTELVLPSHANTLGIAFGGQIMKWMENCASITASRFTKMYVLTSSVDGLRFMNSIQVFHFYSIFTQKTNANFFVNKGWRNGCYYQSSEPHF